MYSKEAHLNHGLNEAIKNKIRSHRTEKSSKNCQKCILWEKMYHLAHLWTNSLYVAISNNFKTKIGKVSSSGYYIIIKNSNNVMLQTLESWPLFLHLETILIFEMFASMIDTFGLPFQVSLLLNSLNQKLHTKNGN